MIKQTLHQAVQPSLLLMLWPARRWLVDNHVLQVEQLIARLRQGASFWGVVFSPLLLAAAIVSLLAARLLK